MMVPASCTTQLHYSLFLFLYTDIWDCIATCFFIDTAHNVIDYIDTIWKILKPGGIWINLGNLLELLSLIERTAVFVHSNLNMIQGNSSVI